MSLSFSQLLSVSWSFFRRHEKRMVVGILFCSVVLIGMQMITSRGLLQVFMRELGSGIPAEQRTQWEEQFKNSGSSPGNMRYTMQLVAGEMERQIEAQPEAQRATFIGQRISAMLMGTLPMMLLVALMALFVTFFRRAYFLLVSTDPAMPLGALFTHALRYILPLFGLSIWVFLRTFLWLPFVTPFLVAISPVLFLLVPFSIIPAIVFLPRFLLAPVILISKKKGINESAAISYAQSKGYWRKIVGNLLLLHLSFSIISAVYLLPFGTMYIPVVAWISILLQQAFSAFGLVFLFALTQTILEHPRAVPVKK